MLFPISTNYVRQLFSHKQEKHHLNGKHNMHRIKKFKYLTKMVEFQIFQFFTHNFSIVQKKPGRYISSEELLRKIFILIREIVLESYNLA